METKKRIILIIAVALILVAGFALIAGKFIGLAPRNDQPIADINASTISTAPAANVANQEEPPTVMARDGEEVLPTVEMGDAVGIVQSLTNDSLTVKTDEGDLTLGIKGAFNIFAFTRNGSEQKNISDVKIGSKISAQYGKDKVIMSMYLME